MSIKTQHQSDFTNYSDSNSIENHAVLAMLWVFAALLVIGLLSVINFGTVGLDTESEYVVVLQNISPAVPSMGTAHSMGTANATSVMAVADSIRQ